VTAALSSELRQLVADRAGYACEYCGLPEPFAAHRHEPDHIVPLQHGGHSGEDNLALACLRCNRYKGPNVGSFDPATGQLVPFFHPRRQVWAEHFAWDDARIVPLTAEARATVAIFRLNDAARVYERSALLAAGVAMGAIG
jgi:hypothetical protein